MTVRFMTTKTGRVHVVTTPGNDRKNSKCGVVKANHGMPVATGGWGKRKGVSPEAALELLDCQKCDSHAVAFKAIEESKTPAQKRAEAKEKAQATREAMVANKPRGRKHKGGGISPARKARLESGPEARMERNVKEHLAFAEDKGWIGKAWESGTMEWTCEVERNGETLRLIYRDGRTVYSRVILASGVEVRLRNSANWKRHAEGTGKVKPGYQPKQRRTGKKAGKAEVVDDVDAIGRLPFSLEEDDDTVIESLLGKQITWRMTNSPKQLDTARVPLRGRNCRITTHPQTGRRILSFYEFQGYDKERETQMLGGERSVYLDKILRAH